VKILKQVACEPNVDLGILIITTFLVVCFVLAVIFCS
jgi:hypothetical protein